MLRSCENTDVFITLDENIYGIHSKRVKYPLFILNIQTPELLTILVDFEQVYYITC